QTPTIRRPQLVPNDVYEPPAAIQNAMLTKDKKPFTYTPGMGGKLDLSQIRSPRMARRVAKNANDEGIEGPPKSALETKPTPPSNAAANLFVQPQVAIPVFPTNIPVPPPANRTPPTPPANRTPTTPPTNRIPSNVPEKQPESVKPVTKVETKMAPLVMTSVQPGSPESPSTPTQVTLAKAPTPWLQNKNKPQEELPEFQQMQQPPQWQPAQQKPQQPQQYQNQQPLQMNQQQQKRPYSSPPVSQQASPQTQERVIPIRIEDRPSVFDVKREQGHHQFKQPSPHHQQRWGQQAVQNQVQSQVQKQPTPQPAPSSGGNSFIIPIMIEGSEKKSAAGPGSNPSYSQPTMVVRNNVQGAENQTVKVIPQRGPTPVVQADSGPVQSRSFRVLQKITDTDSTNDVDPDQIRKLQLLDDDRILMNKFKEQVDNENTLHYEEDPRYRGSAIPSRAFRYLQTMTESGDIPVATTTPRQQSAINKRQNRNSKSFEETQANLPPSEQQVQEPKKYMGSAIPSRSFRILQAMTAPESVATQENRQADYTCQTENNVPGNQQGVFHPPCPPPFWSPEGGWWGYYPLPYPGVASDAYSYHPDNTAYIYFPIYNQNYPGSPRYDPTSVDKNACPYPPPYVIPVPPQAGNRGHSWGQTGGSFATANPESPSSNQDNKSNEANISNGIDQNGLAQWDRENNSVSRTASSNSKDSDCTTAMNITDEEEIPEVIVTSEIVENVSDQLVGTKCANDSLNVAVPNYTYIDTSDSNDSTDSESETDDNESVIESSKSCCDDNSDDTSSDSEDSDSYLAYSTGLNPHGKFEKDNDRNSQRKVSSVSSSEKKPEINGEQHIECDKLDPTFPHQLSVIYEDIEQNDSENPRPREPKNVCDWNETPFEATDDPPDETDNTTVSVSLPLRIKFSVSENNEDVTTVIVGDSTIKPERVYSKDDGRGQKSQENRSQEKPNDVSVNFLVNNDTSVDFTFKKETSENKSRTNGHVAERTKEETVESKMDRIEDPVVPHVNFTLRKIPTRMNRMNCEESIETEFTIKRKPPRKEECRLDKQQEDCSMSTSTVTSNEDSSTISRETVITERETNSKIIEATPDICDINKNILKPEVVVSECNWNEDMKHPDNYQITPMKIDQTETLQVSNDPPRKIEEEDKSTKEPKHLLSVQNSREETDDEDSGVTSDMSRMISEVDTDSECTSSKNIRKYQRTQTHSRLFKLLNDDSILPEATEKTESPARREYLSLPLKNNTFNYDESYCSNYSSGLTSPEYSPVCEQSWRRLHDSENGSTNQRVPDQNGGEYQAGGNPLTRQDRVPSKEDPYYQAWKTSKSPAPLDHDVVPSLAFKTLESKRPPWAYKVNVLCPRIKSTKNVPHTLQTSKIIESSV
ncbi:hypothetical protein WN55_08904, partial [Dufourea novaeangliae]